MTRIETRWLKRALVGGLCFIVLVVVVLVVALLAMGERHVALADDGISLGLSQTGIARALILEGMGGAR